MMTTVENFRSDEMQNATGSRRKHERQTLELGKISISVTPSRAYFQKKIWVPLSVADSFYFMHSDITWQEIVALRFSNFCLFY